MRSWKDSQYGKIIWTGSFTLGPSSLVAPPLIQHGTINAYEMQISTPPLGLEEG